MHRCSSGFVLTLTLVLAAILTGCLGKSSSNPANAGVSSVTLSPASNVSLDVGGTQVFSATARNASGGVVPGVSIQYVVSSGTPTNPSNLPAPLSVAANGNGCAGTWDAAAAICSAGTSGIATVYAVTNGIYSAPAIVYVHQHIDSIQIVQAEPQPYQYDCFSQGQNWLFQAVAYSNNLDITNTVGPFNWSSTNSNVLTATPYIPPQQPTVLNQVQVTAKTPGITQLVANASGTNSIPSPYTTCLIQAIYLQIGGQATAGNSITVSSGGSVSITATAIDTLYKYTGVAIPHPPLTWSTSNPEVSLFGTTTNTTGANSASVRANAGGAILTASCTPPTCNIGLPGVTPSGALVPSLPIYASDGILPNQTQGYGAISVDVTTTKEPTYTAWAATTDCQDQIGCTSALFSLTYQTKQTNPIGTILALPRTPNSLVFNHQSAPRLYIGSDQGLMYVDVGGTTLSVNQVSNSSTPCNIALCGTVLTVSNDGKLAVVSDPAAPPIPGQVYIYNGSSASTAPVDLVFDNPAFPGEYATAAAFSPDQLKLFILTSAGNMYVASAVDALASVRLLASAVDVSFSADGSFAYVAGTPAGSVSAYSTCSQPGIASVYLPATAAASIPPWKLFPSPVMPEVQPGSEWITQNVLALEVPAAGSTGESTSIQTLTAEFTQDPIPYQNPLQFTCNPPNLKSFAAGAQPTSLGQGAFTPLYAQLVNAGNEVIVVSPNVSAVLIYNVGNGTTTSIPLTKIADPPVPLSATASTDGSQVFVAVCDQSESGVCTRGSVHIVSTTNQFNLPYGDIQQVPYLNINDQNNDNMCNGLGTNAPLCLPNLVAIRPQ